MSEDEEKEYEAFRRQLVLWTVSVVVTSLFLVAFIGLVMFVVVHGTMR